ncbi:PBP1A family penicillin-binding protein [Mediterraneibacter glycyrrhizinilyticus]|uniref:transglycosylase domain-containing protein n=1 Tax=Mediterraneibacter glycyrrhizinilyticus TaxID=342942 RepID=UPI001961A6A5|nr:PBP1A family penicillin-binding protein [Mediterraneibacter glycyrrhizinilyticus]
MNYGKNNLSRRKKKISSKKKMQKKRVGVRLFKAVIISLLLLCVIGVAGAGVFAYQIIRNTPEVTAEDIMPQGYTSFIVDQSGNQLETLNDSSSNRVYRTYDQIPEYMAHAFVAIEDSRFYEHNGIDLQGIIRAGVIGVTNGFHFTEGASTLTQQLIKNNVFPDFVNEETLYDRVERKLQEQYLALQIEKELSKEQILEAYMNTINLGQGCLGVQAAATRYFNKDVSDLTLSECAVIAAITQNPTRYDPVKNPDNNAQRRERVLNNMLDQGYITQDEYDEAVADNVYDRILETAAVTTNDEPYSYFVDALIEQLVKDLKTEKGYTETQAYNLIYSGGLTITATQDTEIQKICDEEVANVGDYLDTTEYGLEFALTIHREDGTAENYSQEQLAAYIRDKYNDNYPLVFSSEDAAHEMVEEYKGTLNIGENDTVDENINLTLQPQVSVVLMDQYTGQVKAIVGGRGEKTTSLSLNRATTGDPRQPGSCFKIVSTYAPALNECGMNLSSTIIDEPYKYKNGQEVNNWDKKYIGATTVRYAIEHSMNVCAVRTLTEVVGEEKSYEYLLNFGFTTLTDEDKYSQAKALGGIENGVYNIELTAAYAAIANGGVYTEPILYTQVLDHDGNVLLDNSTPDTHEVIKDSTAYLLTSAMEDVINQGTGTAAQLDNMHAAGKTGTSQNSMDLWLSAYTPYYTASVWGGYDSRKPMENIYNQSWHSRLWKEIMERVHENLEDKDFEVPSSVVECTVCSETGLLAVSSCPSYTEYFSKDNAPTQSCSGHYVEPEPEEVFEETPEEGTTEEPPAETPEDPNAGAVETPPAEEPPAEAPAEQPSTETPPAETAPADPAAPAQ